MTVTDSKATLLKRKTNQFDEEDAPLSVLSCKFSLFWPPPHRAAPGSSLPSPGFLRLQLGLGGGGGQSQW